MNEFRAPFPYFGGKSAVAETVWQHIGPDATNYVEPFFGSGAVLLARPGWSDDVTWTETVNDADGMISNFWRAVQGAPDEVARIADWPVNENDLHARHIWLVNRRESLTARLEGDPDYYDAQVAGWWVWGMACWIGSGFCSGNGPWQSVDGVLVNTANGDGVNRNLVHLGDTGQGVNRQLVHLRNTGQGVNRRPVHLGNTGQGNAGTGEQGLYAWMQALAARLRRVRVCSGDWSRVLGPSPTFRLGVTGVFLDPPYADTAGRNAGLYAVDDLSVAHDVREWAIANGDNPLMRIVVAGYDGEHEFPDSWRRVGWKAQGGYALQGNGNGRANRERETLWISPHCLTRAAEYEQPALLATGNMREEPA